MPITNTPMHAFHVGWVHGWIVIARHWLRPPLNLFVDTRAVFSSCHELRLAALAAVSVAWGPISCRVHTFVSFICWFKLGGIRRLVFRYDMKDMIRVRNWTFGKRIRVSIFLAVLVRNAETAYSVYQCGATYAVFTARCSSIVAYSCRREEGKSEWTEHEHCAGYQV